MIITLILTINLHKNIVRLNRNDNTALNNYKCDVIVDCGLLGFFVE